MNKHLQHVLFVDMKKHCEDIENVSGKGIFNETALNINDGYVFTMAIFDMSSSSFTVNVIMCFY